MEICTCHYKENIEWLKSSLYPVTVVHKEGGDPFSHESFFHSFTVPNIGVEAYAYLSYILDRYDTLPDHVAFLHGHETAVHQLGDRPMLDMIRDANKSKYGYVPLNNYWQCVNLHKNEVNSYLSTSFDKFNLDIKTFITCGGAQFIVSKDRIFRHTKDEYKILLDKIITKDDAVCMELIWHNIFGENINLIPRDDHFEPPLKEIRYSHASNIPMRVCEVEFIYIGKKYFNCDYKKYQNKAKTFFYFAGDFKIYDQELLEEVLVVKDETKLEDLKKYVCDRVLLFEKLYLEEHSII